MYKSIIILFIAFYILLPSSYSMGIYGDKPNNYFQLNIRGSFQNKSGSEGRRSSELLLGLAYIRLFKYNIGVNIFTNYSKDNIFLGFIAPSNITTYHTNKYGGGISYKLFSNKTKSFQNIINIDYFKSNYITDYVDFFSDQLTGKSSGLQFDLKTFIKIYKKLFGTFSVQFEHYSTHWYQTSRVTSNTETWIQKNNAFFTNIGVTFIL